MKNTRGEALEAGAPLERIAATYPLTHFILEYGHTNREYPLTRILEYTMTDLD